MATTARVMTGASKVNSSFTVPTTELIVSETLPPKQKGIVVKQKGIVETMDYARTV